MAGTTVNDALNEALKVIREPEITALESDNILQQYLLEELNNTIVEVSNRADFAWVLKHATLTTTADIHADYAAVTNASTAVTSVTSAGVATNSFTGATTAMWFRAASDLTSYKVTAVDLTSSPDALTLTTAYVGTTSTATSYKLFQDTYPLTTSDLDEVQGASYGDAGSVLPLGAARDHRLTVVSLGTLMRTAGGDLHADTSGRPSLMARIGVDTSNYPQWVLWPYPDSQYVIDVWYNIRYTDTSALTDSLWGADAPPIAYTAVCHRLRAAACRWDRDFQQSAYYEQRYELAVGELLKREKGTDAAMTVEPFRVSYGRVLPVRSGTWFDRKPAQR